MESSCRISITDGLSPEPLPTPVANEFMADNSTAPTIFPSPKDLSEEAEDFLAGANGNFYLSQPGVEGVHDGRIMIRLKKKRFIVVDYSCVPSPQNDKSPVVCKQLRRQATRWLRPTLPAKWRSGCS